MSGDIMTKLYGSNNYRARDPKQELYKNGTIYYCNRSIPVNDILCIREAQNSNSHPKSVVTIAETDPDTGLTTVTEYEYCGSQSQWMYACRKAEDEGLAHIDLKI